MSKDILVFIPSRSKPDVLTKAITQLYDGCDSRENFDILCVVDDDQVELYAPVAEKFPDVIWRYPERLVRSTQNAHEEHLNFLEENDYYFSWYMVDDFWGLQKGWDTAIVSKKDIYRDGYYTLHTTNPFGRNLNALTTQFRTGAHPFNGNQKPLIEDPAFLIFHYHEMMPICTRKWWLELKKFFINVEAPEVVYLNAALVYVLNTLYGYARQLEAGVYYENLIDDQVCATNTINNLSRDENYWQWARQGNFDIIHPVADQVAQEIRQYYRDIMDEPRGWGKHATEGVKSHIDGEHHLPVAPVSPAQVFKSSCRLLLRKFVDAQDRGKKDE
jgi:hypothetical protein